jgi:hypothetical protein
LLKAYVSVKLEEVKVIVVEPIDESTKIAPPCEIIFHPKLVNVFLKLQLIKLILEVLYGTRNNAPPS